jgi:hypothetical protein
VDQIVTDQLTNIESEFYDPKLLLKIYQNLWVRESIIKTTPTTN